ncbi:hypothetical protein L6164_026145 [Bauhinia variegata]|uniref:Uncharacterized protein n=1 Tax=Bauhinia variegata TaxID=167791 RepID=A0ACB9LPF0_BAUVA|nr:hypothetical protein L6164_026145 [Bauhinia variegata]
MLHLFSGSSALFLCFTHAEDLPGDRKHLIIHGACLYWSGFSSHQQSQAARIVNPNGSEKPRARPQIDPDTAQLFSYNNSGRQYIRGVSNQTGYVKGNGNGIINFGNLGTSSITQSQGEVDLTARINALQKLIPRENRMGDGTPTQPNSSSTTALRGENHQPDNFSNTGEQTIEGVTSQTGIIAGNYNGLVNLGCADI